MQASTPNYVKPGNRSVAGSGLTDQALGMNNDGMKVMPDGINLYPGGPSEVTYYNGAQEPPAGGVKKVIRRVPMMGGE